RCSSSRELPSRTGPTRCDVFWSHWSRNSSVRLFVAPGELTGVFEYRIIVFKCLGAFLVADASVGHVSFTPASRRAGRFDEFAGVGTVRRVAITFLPLR